VSYDRSQLQDKFLTNVQQTIGHFLQDAYVCVLVQQRLACVSLNHIISPGVSDLSKDMKLEYIGYHVWDIPHNSTRSIEGMKVCIPQHYKQAFIATYPKPVGPRHAAFVQSRAIMEQSIPSPLLPTPYSKPNLPALGLGIPVLHHWAGDCNIFFRPSPMPPDSVLLG